MRKIQLLAIILLTGGAALGQSLSISGQSNRTYDGGTYTNLSITSSTGITVKNAVFSVGAGSVINIDGSSNVLVENCEANGQDNACTGVNIDGASHHITVKGCHIHNIADDGFQLRGTNLNNITIQGNRIHKLIGKGTEGVISGPCYNGHSDGIETANTDRVSIIGNILYDIQSTSAIIIGGGETNMKLINNIMYTPDVLITCYQHEVSNVEIYHNTIWVGGYCGLTIGQNVANMSVYNNIISKIDFQHLGGTYDVSQMHIDYNLLSMTGSGYTLGTHDKMFPAQSFAKIPNAYSSTHYTDVTAADFGLLATCPGINTGKTGLGITTDILGNPRDAQPDMGAIEYQGTDLNDPAIGKAWFAEKPYPNPMHTRITFPLDGNLVAGNMSLTIYDQQGAAVYTRTVKNVKAAPLHWDGTGLNGEPVVSGVYFYRYTVGTRTLSGSIIKTTK
jgi:hypothetical protein